MRLYERIADHVACGEYDERFDAIMRTAPHAQGFDYGTLFLRTRSWAERLVFQTSFHHTKAYADAHEGYVGWTHHTIIVTPTFRWKIRIRVRGENHNEFDVRNDIHDHIEEVFHDWLVAEERVDSVKEQRP